MKVLPIFMTAALALALANIPACSGADSGTGKSEPVSKTTAGHKDVAAFPGLLKKLINENNAEAVASLWTEDAIFIDEGGEETHGRVAIRQRFESFFSARGTVSGDGPKDEVEIDPERLTFPADNVAILVALLLVAPAPYGTR